MMKQKDDFHRNGSGYYDPTAHKALKNIEREEKTMEIKKGEIWEMEAGNSLRIGIVIANHLGYATVLLLNDEQRPERTIKLNAQGMKCADPGRVSFMNHKDFNKFIRLTTDEEFADIMKQVTEALGLEMYEPIPSASYDEMLKAQAELGREQRKTEKLLAEILQIMAELEELKNEKKDAVKAMVEREVYKSQYESLLERVIAKAV